MHLLIYVILAIPILGLVVTSLINHTKENTIAEFVVLSNGLSTFGFTLGIIYWIYKGSNPVEDSSLILYDSPHYTYQLSFLFDKISATYLMLSSALFFMITKYSQTYLHRETGYKRFYLTMMLFIFSIYIIILSGNFETLFLGWEILGISSFLLIGYYRERYLPVRNAFKVYTYYRLADAGLLLAMWLSHHVWHENVMFSSFWNEDLMNQIVQEHYYEVIIISLLIGLSAAVKSAQFPFSTWLARAMEGPTPSSAIFYGSIAVNIGCFLLLRTYPLWSQITVVKIFFIVFSIITIIMSSITSKVQTSVKAQIAYASITQIAIVFIEITIGWHTIALIHFTGNAFLRAYQLLISPSVVTYVMREQFFNYMPSDQDSLLNRLQNKWRNTVMVAGLKEWRIDSYLYRLLWAPMKKIGQRYHGLDMRVLVIITILAFSYSLYSIKYPIPHSYLSTFLATIFGLVGLVFSMMAFTERKNARRAWRLLFLAHLWLINMICLNDTFSYFEIIYYLSGIFISTLLGHLILKKVISKYKVELNDFYGLIHVERKLGFFFLLCCITIAGFPISTTFIGEDLLFTHISEQQIHIAFITIMVYIVQGIALIRMYSRIFLGPLNSSTEAFARRYA